MGDKPDLYGRVWDKDGKPYIKDKIQNKYTPPLPVSVVKEEPVVNEKYTYIQDKEKDLYGTDIRKEVRTGKGVGKSSIYDPPLPVSVVKEISKPVKTKEGSVYGEVDTEDDQKVGGHQQRYDPPLPVSVVKEEFDYKDNQRKNKDGAYGNNLKLPKSTGKAGSVYDVPLPTSLLEVKSTRGKHSTEKQVQLMEWILKYYSKEGDTILDPTCGSGSTGVACKNMNRNFIGIEMDEEIFKVAENRLKQ